MNTFAMCLGYLVLGSFASLVGAVIGLVLWMYLSRAIFHAYIQTKAFNTYPNGTKWNSGYKAKRFKFLRNMIHNLMHPIRTMRGTSRCPYYVIGHRGLMPIGYIRNEFNNKGCP